MRKKRIFLRDRRVFTVTLWFLVNLLTYYGGRVLTRGRVFFDFTISLDHYLPIWTPAVYVYLATFAFWVIGFFCLGGNREFGYRILAGELVAKLLCLLLFLAIPTQKALPEITGDGLSDLLVKLVFSLDEPNMLMPSIHCLDSYVLFCGAIHSHRINRIGKTAIGLFTLMIFASTLLTGQHVLLDIPAAIAVAEAGFFIERKLHLGARYDERLRKIEDAL